MPAENFALSMLKMRKIMKINGNYLDKSYVDEINTNETVLPSFWKYCVHAK